MGKPSRMKRIILGIAIALVLSLFFGYGINTFYPGPEYEDYCEEYFPEPMAVRNLSECKDVMDINEEFERVCRQQEGIVKYEEDEKGCRVAKECDTCRKEFNADSEEYNKHVFIITSILGLIAVIIGAIFLSVEAVGSGIMGGGVLTIIYGTLRYWGNLADVGRFIILGLVLVILIWLGYKKLNK